MKVLGVFLASFLTFSANAGWTNSQGKVVEVMSHNGIHIIYTTLTDETCSGNGKFWWPKDDPDSDDMYSMALAAFMGGKEIMVVYSPDNPECINNSIAKATHMRIR